MTDSPENQESQEAEAASISLSIGQNLPYIRWALSHATEMGDMIEALAEVAQSDTLDGKWAHTKNAGDILVTIINDFPRTEVNALMLVCDGNECTVAEADELMARFDGSLIKNIIANLPAILEFIKAIIPLFKFAV